MALVPQAVKALKIAYEADLGNLGAVSKQASNALSKTEKKFTDLRNAVTGGLIGVGLAMGVAAITKAANRQEDALRQLEDRLRSTKGAAGITAEELIELSKSLQGVTRFGDEAIQEMEGILLTFTNIKNDVLPETIERVLDVSTVMGQDLKSSAVQLAKALNDPIANLGALSRTGIQFSKDQKETIKTLAETGRLAEAQKIILAELKTQFGGAARAAGETFAGKLAMLSNAFGDLQEEMGKGITQNKGVNEQLDVTIGILKSPELAGGLQVLISGLAAIAVEAVKIITFLPRLIGGLQELGKQADESFSRSAEMAEQFETNFERQLEALEKAGVSFQKFNEITASMEGSERLKEIQVETDKLNDEISELSDLMEKASPQMRVGFLVALEKETKKLNELEAEANGILSKQLQQITKNNKAYEISDATIKKYRENLRGQLKETLDAIPPTERLKTKIKDAGNENKKATKNLENYNVALKITNKEIPTAIKDNLEWEDSLRDTGMQLEGVSAATLTWKDTLRELQLKRQAQDAEDYALKWKKIEEAIVSAIGAVSDFISVGGKFLGLSDDMSRGLSSLASGAAQLFSGDIIGGGLNLIGNLEDIGKAVFGTGDKAKEAAEEFEKWLSDANEMARDLGFTLNDEMNAALAMYLQNLEAGNTAGETFIDFWNRMSNTMEQGTFNLWGFGTQLELTTGQMNDYARAAAQAAALSPEIVSKETLAAVDDLEKLVNGGASSIEDLNQQIAITDLLFSEMMRGGIDAGTAITELDAVIAKLEESAGDWGVTGNETLNKLREYRKLIADNKALVDSVAGLTGSFEQLSKTGTFDPQLTEDAQRNFDNFINQALDKYQDLINAGFDQGQALDMLNPLFNEINQRAEDFGLNVSDSAQELLNLARPDTFDPLTEGINGLTDAINLLVESFSGMGNLTPPQLNDLMMPGFDFGNIPGGAGMAGTQGGTTIINNNIVNVNPGAVAPGAIQNNVRGDASVDQIEDIFKNNTGDVLGTLGRELANIGG